MLVEAITSGEDIYHFVQNKLVLKKGASCIIIGQGTLPLACAKLLLECDAVITAVISTDKHLVHWAKEHAIPLASSPAELHLLLGNQSCDFIFSIVNPFILSEDILSLANICAINYHDSPLPRYAGTHATAWALMAGESSHAITWHIMENRLDAGDILVQEPVAISENETSLTLNLKCQNAALRGFKDLLIDLQNSNVNQKQQSLSARSFFPTYRRPEAGCVLSWNKTAEELSALVRGLDFGVYQNPLGLPKIQLNNEFILIGELKILDQKSWGPPGTILSCAYDMLIVRTLTFDVSLNALRTFDGKPLSIAELVAQFSLEPYQQPLPIYSPANSLALTNLCSKFARHENFWVNCLQHESHPTGLPFVKPAATRKSISNYARHFCAISSTQLSLPNDSDTRVNWLLTTFAIYLARINGEANLNIGLHESTLATELGQFASLFADTLPLQLTIDLNHSFTDIVDCVTKQRLLLAERGSYARDTVLRYPAIRDLAKLPTTDRWPLVVQLLDDVNDSKKTTSLNNGQLITLQISADGRYCNWLYNTALVDTRLIERIATQFFTLFTHLVTTIDVDNNTQVKAGALNVMDDVEKQQVLINWNATQVHFPKDNCIHELIETQTRQHPQATALVFEHLTLSYQQLNDRANQLAHYLRAQQITTGSLVGLSMERGLDMIVGILAIFKAGAAYVPLDPTYPPARLDYMLKDSDVKTILTSTTLAQSLYQQTPQSKICLDDINISRAVAEYPHHNITKQSLLLAADNLAYVIYTSGSTGKPKGTLVRHSGLCNLAMAQIEMFAVTPQSKVLQFASMSFDAAISECVMALCVGAALVLMTKDTTQSAEKLNRIIADKKITHVTLPPVLLPLMDPNSWTSVETLAVAGEACSLVQANIWSQGRRFINAYGPTETTVCASMGLYSPGQSVLHIGKPMNNTQLYVVNDYLQPQPIGVAGELLIGGAGLAVGYLHQPELTEQKFIPNPFSKDTTSRLYKTGDLVRWLEDGNLEFLGRIDHQVKIRGFRIELGEIESCLLQHAYVSEAVVIAREDNARKDSTNNKTLAAYVVTNTTKTESHNTESNNDAEIMLTLKQHLQSALPDYMVPASLTLLSHIPLTPNGKVDRKALPEPAPATHSQHSYVAPQSEMEKIFCDVWQNVLQLERVGITDNFFQLGGNSILVFYAIVQLSRRGVELTPEKIYEAPTIVQLSRLSKFIPSDNKNKSILQQDTHALVVGKAPVLPNALDILSAWTPNHWNSSFILKCTKPYTSETIYKAAVELLNHHDALRTLWQQEDGIWNQYFQSPDEMLPWWKEVDLSHLSDVDASTEIENYSAREQTTLTISGILLKVTYFNLGEGRSSRILFILNHMLVDNYSINLLINDFGFLCAGYHDNTIPQLPAKTTSVKVLAEAFERYITLPDFDRDLDYWLNRPWHQYQPIPKETEPEKLTQECHARTLSDSLSIEETRLLEALPQRENITLQDLFLTALVMAYGDWSGRKALTISLTSHGRSSLAHESVDLSRTIGLLPIPSMYFLVLPENISLRDSITSIKRQREAILGKEASQILLKRKHPDTIAREKILNLPGPQLSQNLIGRLPELDNKDYGLKASSENVGPQVPEVTINNDFPPYSTITFQEDVFKVEWTFCTSMYTQKTIQGFLGSNMNAIRALIHGLK